MSTTKVAVSLETRTLREIDRLVREGRFPSRSRAIQTALAEMTSRHKHRRLIQELAKLNPKEEQELAEEFFAGESPWPEY
jgi:Arc/MetJ-type ribon-helix-helix transcriptional regulator